MPRCARSPAKGWARSGSRAARSEWGSTSSSPAPTSGRIASCTIGRAPHYAAITADTIDWTRVLTGAAWLHGSGITPALGDGPRAALAAAIRAARAAGASVSVDLNYRPALWQGRDPRAVIEPLVREADLLIANRDAVRTMLGVDASPDDATLAPRLAARYGFRRVALTRREVLSASEHRWSASLYDATTGSSNDSRHHDVRVVDRVGGGDSFAAGLVAALLRGRPGPRPWSSARQPGR